MLRQAKRLSAKALEMNKNLQGVGDMKLKTAQIALPLA